VKRLFNSMVLAAALAVAPTMTACNRSASNPDYEGRVKDSLKTAKIDDVKADWKADEKALHLSGDVQNAADKARAEELAKQVVGTSGRVVNEVKIAGTNMDDVDKRIEKDLDAAFKEDDQFDRDNLDLTFNVKAGVVTIKGEAPSEAAKERITAKVRTVPGVTDVVNDLQINPEKGKPMAKTPKRDK
jgi:hyperosmotically inducible periplasmic protein